MLDYVSNGGGPATEWQHRLTIGDTVSFRFPVTEEQGGPPPKARPCLILAIRDIDGVRHALVAYGTSAQSDANRGHEVEVDGAGPCSAAGLHRRTRFVCARRVLVALISSDFVVSRDLGTPVLGRLDGDTMMRLERLRNCFEGAEDTGAPEKSLLRTRTAKQVEIVRRRSWLRSPKVQANRATHSRAVYTKLSIGRAAGV